MDVNTCRVCKFKHELTNGSKDTLNEFSLIQLTDYPCDDQELFDYYCRPAYYLKLCGSQSSMQI